MKGEPWFSSIDLYPWFFALAPLASLLNENLDALYVTDALRSALLLAGLTLLALEAGGRILGDRKKAAILWTAAVTVSYAIGLVARAAFAGLSAHRLPAAYGGGFLAWLAVVGLMGLLLRKVREIPPALTAGLNLAGIIVLALPLAQILSKEFRMDSIRRTVAESLVVPPVPQDSPSRPDIFYIILDGYGRQDVLAQIYDLANDDFYRALEARGFTVAPSSRANYVQTSLSFASALNMSHLTGLTHEAGDPSQWTIAAMIRESALAAILRSQGYRTTAFTIGYRRAEMSTADVVLRRPHPHATPLEALLIETSALAGGMYLPTVWGEPPWLPGYADHADGVEWTLSQAVRAAQEPGPKFVFIHLLIPHPPFVFGPHGEILQQAYPYRLGDGSDFRGSDQEYLTGYRDQVKFANAEALKLIDAILDATPAPPVIVLQGDHGPGSQLSWEDPERTNMAERLSILNAYLVPGLDSGKIDPGISPVNSFRMILGSLFGYALPTLPDASYYSTWRAPYDFVRVDFTSEDGWTLEDAR